MLTTTLPLFFSPTKPPVIPSTSRQSLPLLSKTLNPLPIRATHHSFPHSPNPNPKSSTAVSAGRSKKNSGGGRIEGDGDTRRAAKENARRRSRRLSENLFYRRSRQHAANNQADAFTEEELEMIGLGYDRAVRFMSKDDPNLRHPHDWYKYGRYGPYSWRGIVVGPPIRGRFSDDRVSLINEVRNHEEWEEIEKFDMANDFFPRLQSLDRSIGFRHYWVFVRHPKWKPTELPWEQWTLVAEVVLEAGKQQRLDKWNLMGRLGNKTRAMITQCAAWMRPDIIYVKRPVYQSRFEPQAEFFELLGPLLDPSTENAYPCVLKVEDEGRVEGCTYFGGLCKIVKISQKAYVDDVVAAYSKLSDEGKSRCLEFLLTNHPTELLHPYTKEWKAKLEEMELGCDAPDESDNEDAGDVGDERIIDWIEGSDGSEDEEEEDDVVIDMGEDEDVNDESVEGEEEEDDVVIDMGEDEDVNVESVEGEEEDGTIEPEETAEYWNKKWKEALRSSDAMEKLVKKSIELSAKSNEKATMKEEKRRKEMSRGVGRTRERHDRGGYRGSKRMVKSKIPPELFLRAAVRPFTYRDLVKEIVLMRHAIVDGDISVIKGEVYSTLIYSSVARG